jgi:hypothetical protein
MSYKLATEPVPLGHIAGFCPFGCGETLVVADGGHIVCNAQDCDNPTAVDQLLHLPLDHFVYFTEQGFTVEHTLKERITGTMASCDLQRDLITLAGMPVLEPGRYRAVRHQADGYSESYRGDAFPWDFVPAE